MNHWIVVVDDEPISLTNAKEILSRNGMRVSCLRSGNDLLKYMDRNDPDLILLDILMPEMDGFETYRALRQYEEKTGKTQTPVIFLTGESDSETERRGLKAGASDFIHKPFDEDILIKRINNTIAYHKTIKSLTEEATLDKLTGFLNKASGTEKIESLCKQNDGTLMIFDLDNFKLVNDIYGHDMGDRVLVAFSAVLRRNVRVGDVISRIGGDEFMAFFIGLYEEDAVSSLVDRLNEGLASETGKLMGKDHGIPLGISSGAAFSRKQSNDYQILFQYADSALYRVKQNGKHGYAIYDAVIAEDNRPDDLAGELQRAIQIVSERGDGSGAMILGQEAFSWNYRFIVRFLKRYGGIANRVFFSVTSKEDGPIFSEITALFGSILKKSLRRSDIIFQYKPNRFFVMLPQLKENDTPGVIERVMKAWDSMGYKDRATIEYVSMPESFERK